MRIDLDYYEQLFSPGRTRATLTKETVLALIAAARERDELARKVEAAKALAEAHSMTTNKGRRINCLCLGCQMHRVLDGGGEP